MIEVRYKCLCMDAERSVSVRPRTVLEDVVDWVDGVMRQAIAQDHRLHSPRCLSTTSEYVKIMVPENAPGIGEDPKMDS